MIHCGQSVAAAVAENSDSIFGDSMVYVDEISFQTCKYYTFFCFHFSFNININYL